MLIRVLSLVESDRTFGAVLLVIIAGWMLACSSGTPPGSETPVDGPTGSFRNHTYTSIYSEQGSMFFFEPALPARDGDLLTDAIQHILRTHMRLTGDLRHSQVGQVIAFITEDARTFNATPVRGEDGGPFMAVLIQEQR